MSKQKDYEKDLTTVTTVIVGIPYLFIKFIVIIFIILIKGIKYIIKGIIWTISKNKSEKINESSDSKISINIDLDTSSNIKQEKTNDIFLNKKSKIIVDNKLDEELEKEMEAFELEEWQKELVRNDDYAVTSFDEEEVDEDSYFYEE